MDHVAAAPYPPPSTHTPPASPRHTTPAQASTPHTAASIYIPLAQATKSDTPELIKRKRVQGSIFVQHRQPQTQQTLALHVTPSNN
ncbi:hypothetical protein E2C01_044508 [Portunus trituberculatus]|uniref:Uncharacterized protein n=1 Tax=Portunus trituberculatus TaxID=210409 RepID=A0A5B7FZJ0_PORTR|nr:hypothetical protein [Portunus trituberculatus]